MSILLRQPHGFEGLRSVGNFLEPDDFPLAVSDEEGRRNLDVDTTALASKSQLSECNDAVTYVPHVVIGRVKHLEALGIVREELSQAFMAAIGALDRCPLGYELPVFGEAIDPRIEVASMQRFEGLHEELHVLLRHRPRSIPQAQESV